MRSRLRGLSLLAGYVLVAGAGASFFSGFSCIYVGYYCDDDDDALDDDDDGCDDDDDAVTGTAGDAGPAAALDEARDELFRLAAPRLVRARDGSWMRVETGSGPSLFAFEGAGVASAPDLEAFGARLLDANAGLLGWSGARPALRPAGVTSDARRIVVGFDADGGGTALVELDRLGTVVALERFLPAAPAPLGVPDARDPRSADR